METSVKAAEVLVPPEADMSSSPDAEPASAASSSTDDFVDPMKEFNKRLEDIIRTHGSAATLPGKQDVVEAEMGKMMEETKDDMTVALETEVSLIKQSLNDSSTPEEKLEDLVRKYAELAASRRCDEKKLSVLLAERRSNVAARSKLEALCRELQGHYNALTDETIQRCREDEEKRKEMTSHFQQMLTEIQAQIEQHSVRNDKLCRENANLTDKLESLMNQCEQREESLEKINKHRELQYKLTEAKLQQANALLTEAEERHKREKEYLLREAIDKTKKCFAMKEQELAMKKKLTLYGQKFDEFQATLAKSNEIYVRFKKEMDNMSEKMKTLEKESNLWRMRFENCNKALTDMIEERNEKGKEYDLFVLKIQKLEKLCRALQEERKVLYEKIKDVRQANSSLPSKIFGSSMLSADSEDTDKSAILTPVEIQELQEEDPALTEDMARLRKEQAKLQEFADSLLASADDDKEEDNNDIDLEEDIVASAFVHFKTKTQVKEEEAFVTEEQMVVAKPELPQLEKVEEVQQLEESTPEQKTPETIPAEPKPEAQPQIEKKEVPQVSLKEEMKQQLSPEEEPTAVTQKVQINPPTDPKPVAEVQLQLEDKEVLQVKPAEEQPAEQEPTAEAEKSQINPPTDPKPEATEVDIVEETGEAKPVVPAEDDEVQQPLSEPQETSEETPGNSELTPPSENTSNTAASSTKQPPKKKKKKGGKSAS